MKLLHGDLFDVLPTLDANSIDACVTDPPYGIGFMGREWDTFKPSVVEKTAESGLLPHPLVSDNPNLNGRRRSPAVSRSQIGYDRSLFGQREFQEWTTRWAREVLRIVKPGAYIVVCGAPRSHHRMMCGLEDAGFVVRDCFAWLFGSGFPKNKNLGDGLGTALKPAHEPIVLAWKPFKGTITSNLKKYGTGALNINACRLESVPPLEYREKLDKLNQQRRGESAEPCDKDLGRWPANVLLDQEAADLLDVQTMDLVNGGSVTGEEQSTLTRNTYGEFKGRGAWDAYGDCGGASRFYYVAKPSREERDFGCELLPDRTGGEATDREEGSAGLQSPRAGAGRTGGSKNFHPTVKPVELMRWLVRLITPVNGVVLDPFLGSGTTGMACRYESREFIGIEREEKYLTIATARIEAVAPLFAATE